MKNKVLRKILVMTRFGFYGFLIQCVSTSFLIADNGLAQQKSIYEVYLSLEIQEERLVDTFDLIEDNTGFKFAYNDYFVEENHIVSLKATSASLGTILSEISKQTNLKFRRINENIHVNKRKIFEPKVTEEIKQIQPIPVSGQVISSDDSMPLPGVNVIIKGTTNGTVTDLDGRYQVEVPGNETVLVFSYVGFVKQEVVVGNQVEINVSLSPDLTTLGELVVIGYGSAKKTDLTGAVSTLPGGTISKRQTIKASEALQGAIPGVTVNRTDGRPGVDPQIRIRGVTTIGNSNPYVLIDGVPGNLNSVNPYDIENISVLKDGASAAIYGAKAAAGVILITTKRGKSGQLDLSYTFEYGVRKPTRTPNYVGAVDYMTFINERDWNDSGNIGSEHPTFEESLIEDYPNLHAGNSDLYPDTDYSTFFNDYAPTQRHSLSINAGTDKLSSLLSMSYSLSDGFMDTQEYETLTLRSNNDITFSEIVSAHFDISYQNFRDNRENGYGMVNLLRRPPIGLPFWSDGRAALTPYYGADMARSINGGVNKLWNDEIRGRLSIDVKPAKGLTLTGLVSPYFSFYRGKAHLKKVPLYRLEEPDIAGYAPSAATTKLVETRNNSNSVIAQFFANYSITLSNDHNIDAMAGYEYNYLYSENLSASRDQYSLDDYPYLDLGPLDLRDNSGNATELASSSFFGRVMYNYKSKYLMQVNVRYDGSSRFHSDYRWGLFPSVSAGWVLSEESFMENVGPVSLLKLRGSYGSLGNDRIGSNYPYQSKIAFSNALLFSGQTPASFQTAYVPQYAISDISWETTNSWDIGLDVNFFDNRLQLTADYFDKTTSDMLLDLEIPSYIGLSNPSQNAGEMETKGWEFGIQYGNNIGDLYYTISGNMFDSKSTMGDLEGTEFLGSQVIKEGSEFNEWYGYRTDGLFQTQTEVDNSVTLRETTKPGDIKYLDLSGPEGSPDGIINQYDLTLLGGSLPRLQYGGSINLEYKGLDLSIIFQGVGKRNSYKDLQMVIPDHFGVADFVYGNTWSHYNDAETNRNAPYPIGGELGRSHNYETSDYWLFNGSYFRLKNVILGYNLPDQIIQKVGMKNLRVSVNLSDLFSIDNYPSGYDPEQGPGRGYFITKAYILSLSAQF
ncbi:MAG: SusC/RagA family TonB-linked outer membrane protein [Cyclobacteriaceae bacterium]|nr:MAG: SusC/RagA family TonB-linked outer membrane protein [Cyclobacteriaceae bacterium]